MKNFKRIIIALIVACVITASITVSGSVVDAKTISIKNGNAIEEITINKKSGKVTTKDTSHKAGWYKKSGVQYYFGKNKKIASYKWQNKTLYKWQNGSFKKYTGTKRLSNDKSYYFNNGKKASGVVKVSGKYYYFNKGKKSVCNTSKGVWKKVSKNTKVYFGKGNKSATYAMYKNTLKKWNKTTKKYAKYTGKKRLDDNKTYYFNKGKKYNGAKKGTDGKFYKYKNGKNTSTLANGLMVYTDGKCYSFKNGEKVGKFTGINGGKYYKNGVEQSVAAGTEVTDNGKRFKYSNKEWIALTGKGNDNCFYVKGVKANGTYEFDNVYYSCKNGKGTKLEGIQKTSGKYYHFSKGIKGDAVDGITLIESKYYVFDEGTKGGAADGIKKLDGYYYKFSDGAIATLKGWNGKHYYNKQYQITYKKDENLVYKWSKSKWELFTGTLAGVEYEDGAEKTDNDTPGDSENPSDKDEEKLTEGEFRTNSGKLQHCEAVLYTGDIGTFPNLWNFRDGKLEMGIESTFNVDNYVNFIKRDNKYYHLEWVDYTGEYEGKLYESGKVVDYKVRTKSGDLFTGWAIYEDVIPNAATEFYHLTTGYSHNLVYVESGVVKQYYVYEKNEKIHRYCNECGADITLENVDLSLSRHAEECHKGTIMPELYWDGATDNTALPDKYTNNGKTYWVTASYFNYYRWDTSIQQYVKHFVDNAEQNGRVCVDAGASDLYLSKEASKKTYYVVYSASDWKVGQSSVIVVEDNVVLK